MENKGQRKSSTCEQSLKDCVRRHEPAHIGRLLETMKCKFSTLNTEIWNESHIAWGPFQTLIFQLYKALHGIFSKNTENPKEKPKIH